MSRSIGDSPIHRPDAAGVPVPSRWRSATARMTVLVWRFTSRMSLYLIDTDVADNARKIASPHGSAAEIGNRLWGFLLGIGGVRILRALGIQSAVWHCNEGHSAFLTLERIREFVSPGTQPCWASDLVGQSTVFTTPPVPAGHDIFPFYWIPILPQLWGQLGLSREEFLRLGETPENAGHGFQR